MKNLFLLFVLISKISAFGDTVPSPFGNPTYSGSGCPKNSVGFLPTEDAFSLLFSKYTAEKGPNVSAAQAFKYCYLKIPVTVPAGYRAEITTVDYRGFTSLQNRTSSYIHTSFYLGAYQYGSSPLSHFKGPNEIDFFRRDTSLYSRKNWCSNGRTTIPLNLYTLMSVTGSRNAASGITMDSADGVVELKMGLTRCRP